MRAHRRAAHEAGLRNLQRALPWTLLWTLLWTVLFAASSGCAHSSRAERAHMEALRDALETHAFPVSPQQAQMRLLALSVRSEGRLPVVDEGCSAHGCSLRLGFSERDEVRLQLTGAPQGPTRVEVARTQPFRTRSLLAQVWRALDEAGLEDALAGAARVAEAEALDEWRTFRPRWGLTGAAYFATGARQSGFGARVGVRRWHEPHVLTGALLESEWGTLSPSPGAPSVATHLLALPVRVELAPWTDFSEEHGLPDTSFSLFAGPSVLLPGPLGPEAHLGFRAGLGVQLLHASDGVLLPLMLEAHVQHLALPGGVMRDLRLVVGVGF